MLTLISTAKLGFLVDIVMGDLESIRGRDTHQAW
jgi:hypothetical protein